jgi:archaemetzincin
MIRVITLDEFDPLLLKEFTKNLFTAFGVGSEITDSVTTPHGQQEPYDAQKLLESLPKVTAFRDDKVLFLTSRKLLPRKLTSGEAPTYGLSNYATGRSIVTSAHIKSVNENVALLSRFAMQEIGHAYGLHHCLDARCAMYPQWVPHYLEGEASLCTYCRESSERKIRDLKS